MGQVIGVKRIYDAFTPKQQAATDAMDNYRYILYGGARGGGKSRWLRWACIWFLLKCYLVWGLRNVRIGLFCETYPDLRDRQVSKIKTEFPDWMGEIKDTKEDGLCFFLGEENGAGQIALRNLDDPTKYQSAEFALIAVDELTKITKDTFDILRGSLRWPGIDQTLFIAATNPGGVGHGWVRGLWVDRKFPPELSGKADEFVFIQSLPKDNEYLPKSYWDELNSLPPLLVKAWVEGSWDVFAGQAFNFSRERHVITQMPDRWEAWPKWRSIDWGYSNPWCCLWHARNPDNGRIITYREAYQTNLTDRQQARMVMDMTPPHERITVTYADPSMWATKNMEGQVSSTADEYAGAGVPLTRADNDRLGGKRKLDRLLEPLPDGLPGLQIFVTCSNLIRTLPALAYDNTKTEDVDTDQEDHAYDTLRYGLTQAREYKQTRPNQWQAPAYNTKGLF